MTDENPPPRPSMSRQEAHAQGLKRFYTGKACHVGHVAERYVSSGACLECVTFKTPTKHVPARNIYWPERPIVFEGSDCPTPEERQAAYNYMLASGWHYAALEAIRKDPTVLAAHLNVVPLAEVAKADALISQRNRQVALLHAKSAKPVTDGSEGEG